MESCSKNSYRQSGVAAYLFLMEVSDDSSKLVTLSTDYSRRINRVPIIHFSM